MLSHPAGGEQSVHLFKSDEAATTRRARGRELWVPVAGGSVCGDYGVFSTQLGVRSRSLGV